MAGTRNPGKWPTAEFHRRDPSTMRILVFTTDLIPLPGVATSGTALRTWGIAQGLKAHGHEIVISVPRSALSGFNRTAASSDLPSETIAMLGELKRLAFDSSNQEEILATVNPDAIVCGHWPAMTLSQKPRQPLIIDLAGPHILERHYQKSDNQPGAIIAKLNAVASADSYIVSGPSQRLYFLSYLLRAGVDDAAGRIAEITMPLDPNLPDFPVRGLAADSPRFVFGGVFLPWQDPSRALLGLSAELTARGRGMLRLIGGKHPNYDIDSALYRELFAELSKNSRVTTLPMLPYEKFISELGQSDVALDVMRWNLERQLAVTIRSTTYLWAGVPVIYNDFADLAGLVRNYDAGWTISPDDPSALKQVIEQIYSDPSVIAAKSPLAGADAVRRLVEETETKCLVVGVPLNQDGKPGPQAEKVLAFVAILKQTLSIEIVLQDERFSTAAAQRELIAAGVRRKARKQLIDKAAAQRILTTFLDRRAHALKAEQP